MLFNSFEFLVFLPIVFLLYWFVFRGRQWQNVLVVAASYIKEGDVVVMQLEYGNFFNGGNGESETYPVFVKSTNWRYVHQLNVAQCSPFLYGS
jgi:hypothetical protein